ncbi:endonuclease domain-containing protein [Candidatus Gracilibacteria bacterium]|nr:endonuclease domain-containing protein [Candidatus Gracilibacteria bacterium]
MSNGAIYYNPKLKQFAKINRSQNTMTKYEGIFWNLILKGNKTGYRFLRQKIIATYILDFYCGKLKLAIEIDGESHNYSVDYDEKRNKILESFGIKTIRYSNYDIQKNLEGVFLDLQEQIRLREKEI